MIYTIFEYKPENFSPFSINHATFEVRSGAFSILDRITHSIKSNDKIILVVRDEIKEIVADRFPDFDINPEIIPPSTLLYSDHSLINDGSYSADKLIYELSLSDFRNFASNIDGEESYLWSFLFSSKKSMSSYDINYFNMKLDGEFHDTSIMLNKKDIHYHLLMKMFRQF